MLGRVSQAEFDEERCLRLEAERSLAAAQQLADERLSTINDWRDLYRSEVKARAADRQTHAEEMRELLDRFMPERKDATTPPATSDATPSFTSKELAATPVAGKRSMRQRTHQIEDLRFREAGDEERKELAKIREARRNEPPDDLSGFHYDNALGVLVPDSPESQSDASN